MVPLCSNSPGGALFKSPHKCPRGPAPGLATAVRAGGRVAVRSPQASLVSLLHNHAALRPSPAGPVLPDELLIFTKTIPTALYPVARRAPLLTSADMPSQQTGLLKRFDGPLTPVRILVDSGSQQRPLVSLSLARALGAQPHLESHTTKASGSALQQETSASMIIVPKNSHTVSQMLHDDGLRTRVGASSNMRVDESRRKMDLERISWTKIVKDPCRQPYALLLGLCTIILF
jgi:hypothetical protein